MAIPFAQLGSSPLNRASRRNFARIEDFTSVTQLDATNLQADRRWSMALSNATVSAQPGSLAQKTVGILRVSLSGGTAAQSGTFFSPNQRAVPIGLGELVVSARIRLATNPSANLSYSVLFGLRDQNAPTATTGNAAFVRWNGDTAGGQWQVTTRKDGTNNESTNPGGTGAVATVGTDFQNIDLVFPEAGTQVDFYFNGVKATSVSTTVPVSTMGIFFLCQAPANAPAADIDWDYADVFSEADRGLGYQGI